MSLQTESYDYFFTTDPDRLKGRGSRFRQGKIVLKPGGLTFDGKAVLPTPIQVLIIIGSTLFMGYLIAALLLEYVVRVDHSESYTWDQIDSVVIDREKQRAGIVYRQPENPKKRISITLKMPLDALEHFRQAMQYFIGDRVEDRRIPSQNTLRNLLSLLAVLVGAVVLILVLAKLNVF